MAEGSYQGGPHSQPANGATIPDCNSDQQDGSAGMISSFSSPNGSPKSVVDETPITIDKNKESLKLKLMLRRPITQLVDQGILPPLKTPPAFFEQRQKLERAKMGDLLRSKIQRRPDRQELIQQHILEDSNIDPSLQDKQRQLKKARLADDLNDRLSHRPGPLELIKGNILKTDEVFAQAVRDGQIHFKKTCEGQSLKHPSSPDFYLPEDDSSSESAMSPCDTDSSPPPPPSVSKSFDIAAQSPGLSQIGFISVGSVSSVTGSCCSNTDQIVPVVVTAPPAPSPSLGSTVSSLSPLSSISSPPGSVQPPPAQSNVFSSLNTTLVTVSPLGTVQSNTLKTARVSQFLSPVIVPKTEVVERTQSPCVFTTVPILSAKEGTTSNIGKMRKKSKLAPKQAPKTRTIKFHEYKGPPSAQKNQSTFNLAPGETSYELLLKQQQLFLQWQLEWQHKYPQIILPATQKTTFSLNDCSSGNGTNSIMSSAPVAPVRAPSTNSLQNQTLVASSSNPPTPATAVPTPAMSPIQTIKVEPQACTTTSTIHTYEGSAFTKTISKLEDLKVADLKAECKKRNLPVSGPKPQLVERLRSYSTEVITSYNNNNNNSTAVSNNNIAMDTGFTDNDCAPSSVAESSSSGDTPMSPLIDSLLSSEGLNLTSLVDSRMTPTISMVSFIPPAPPLPPVIHHGFTSTISGQPFEVLNSRPSSCTPMDVEQCASVQTFDDMDVGNDPDKRMTIANTTIVVPSRYEKPINQVGVLQTKGVPAKVEVLASASPVLTFSSEVFAPVAASPLVFQHAAPALDEAVEDGTTNDEAYLNSEMVLKRKIEELKLELQKSQMMLQLQQKQQKEAEQSNMVVVKQEPGTVREDFHQKTKSFSAGGKRSSKTSSFSASLKGGEAKPLSKQMSESKMQQRLLLQQHLQHKIQQHQLQQQLQQLQQQKLKESALGASVLNATHKQSNSVVAKPQLQTTKSLLNSTQVPKAQRDTNNTPAQPTSVFTNEQPQSNLAKSCSNLAVLLQNPVLAPPPISEAANKNLHQLILSSSGDGSDIESQKMHSALLNQAVLAYAAIQKEQNAGKLRTNSLPLGLEIGRNMGTPVENESDMKHVVTTNTNHFSEVKPPPPDYAEATQQLHKARQLFAEGLLNNLTGNGPTYIKGSPKQRSQAVDDVLEILIKNGELPPSAAVEPPTPPTPKGNLANILYPPSQVTEQYQEAFGNIPSFGLPTNQNYRCGTSVNNEGNSHYSLPLPDFDANQVSLNSPSSIPASMYNLLDSLNNQTVASNNNHNGARSPGFSQGDGLELDFGDLEGLDGLDFEHLGETGIKNDSGDSGIGSVCENSISDNSMQNNNFIENYVNSQDLVDLNDVMQMDIEMSDWLDDMMPNTSTTNGMQEANCVTNEDHDMSDPLLSNQHCSLDLFSMDDADFKTSAELNSLNWEKIDYPM